MLSRVGEPAVVKKKRGRKRGAKVDKRTGRVMTMSAKDDIEIKEISDDEDDQEHDEAIRMAVTHALRRHHPELLKESPIKDDEDDDANADLEAAADVDAAWGEPETHRVTSLMTAAEDGRLNLVRGMLTMGLQDVWATDDHGHTAYDRLRALVDETEADGRAVSAVHREILNLLQTHMVRHPAPAKGASGARGDESP